MVTILVVALGAGILTCMGLMLFAFATSKKRKYRNKVLHRFSELGTHYKVSFSSQELLKNTILGWDGVQRKLLVLHGFAKENEQVMMIDLAEVTSCILRKKYGTGNGGSLLIRKLEICPEQVALQFRFKEGKQPVLVPFYQQGVNRTGELPELEQKARQWETLFFKLTKVPDQKIA